jgi:hypothetical protein
MAERAHGPLLRERCASGTHGPDRGHRGSGPLAPGPCPGSAGQRDPGAHGLVILTGLITSTALNMIVVPALLSRWGGGVTRPSAPLVSSKTA